MYDVELVLEILSQIHEAGKRIERRFSPVRHLSKRHAIPYRSH